VHGELVHEPVEFSVKLEPMSVVVAAYAMVGAASTVMVKLALVAEFEAWSVTLTVNVETTGVVGVPVIAPEEELMDSPVGRVPELITYVQGVLEHVPVEFSVKLVPVSTVVLA
jgi:hypothetical protein